MTIWLLTLVLTTFAGNNEGGAQVINIAGKFSNKADCEVALDALTKGSIKNRHYVCFSVKQ